MCNENNTKKGFTLIELLIVIAIIGVLAATVVISVGDRAGLARETTVKLGVSGIRSLASAEVASPTEGVPLSADLLCDNIYPKVSGEKTGWHWDSDDSCTDRKALTKSDGKDGIDGEICCSAVGKEWVVWGALEKGVDGHGSGGTGDAADIYCADSAGFLGTVKVKTTDASGPTTTSVEDGAAAASPVSCRN